MELNNKEKKIKQVLSDLNYEVDTDFLWSEVSKELDKKKKKRRFFWIFPILGLAIGAFFFINNQLDATPLDLNSNLQTSVENVESPSQKNIQAVERNVVKNKKDNKVDLSNKDLSVDFNVESQTKPINTNQKDLSTNRQIKKGNGGKDSKTHRAASKNNNKSIIAQAKTQVSRTTFKHINKENLIGNTLIKNLGDTEINTYPPLTFVPVESLGIKIFDIEEKENIELPLVIVQPCSFQNKFFLITGVGAIRDIGSVEPIGDFLPSKLFDREKSLWGLNSSLLFGVEMKNTLRFFGGLDYSQLVTQYYNGETENLNGEALGNYETIDSQNNYSSIEGYLSTSTTIENDLLWHRRHNMLNFQIGLSKELFKKSRFNVAPEVSLLQNIFTSHRGYYFTDSSSHFTTFERGEESPYRKNTGLKTQLGLNFIYQYSGWEFNLKTAWRKPLTSLTSETNIYQINNSQIGIQLSMIYLIK